VSLTACAAQVAEEVPSAKALFDTASEILGYDLLDRAVNGPKDVLDSTVRCLPPTSRGSPCQRSWA
jgi:hypothetical protein